MGELIPEEVIERKIFMIRGHKVMLDKDLAELYGVPVKRLNEQVKRNIKRFPKDFMFQLSQEELACLRSQNVISKIQGRGGRRYLPHVFTEQGVAMLSTVLRSKRAIQVNVEIMRTFVKLRRMLESNKELKKKLAQLEQAYDKQFSIVFDAIRQLIAPAKSTKKLPIGFTPWAEETKKISA